MPELSTLTLNNGVLMILLVTCLGLHTVTLRVTFAV